MDLINVLLGFAVLSSPLWLILILLPVSVWIALKTSKRFKTISAKLASALSVFLLVFLVLFADEIVGKKYLDHLCATEAGVNVYQTVELPAEYWDEKGRPRYLAKNGFVEMNLLPNRFGWNNVTELKIDWIIKINERRWQLLDRETQIILGERVTFMRYFGWLNSFSPAPNIGEGCKFLGAQLEREQEQKLFNDIFKPVKLFR